jgi:acetolactate synthase-1/3 small subunit
MEHVISVLVENKRGVLAHIAGLFSGRGFNIDSLAVGETDDRTVSRMTIVVHGDDRVLEQVTKQLNKMIDVIKVTDLNERARIERELVLIKVAAEGPKRSEVIEVSNIFRAKVVDVTPKEMTLEATGDPQKIDAFLRLLSGFGIKEISRTGRIAISRGLNGEA